MSRTATATLQTPWDCKWSRFGRFRARQSAPAEGLWVCVYPDGNTRHAIEAPQCETCAHWEYESPFAPPAGRSPAVAATTVRRAPAVAAGPRLSRAEKRTELGTRVAALALAVIFAATGFVVLTRPLAIPLTISLWIGALTCFLLGIWGQFNRRFLPDKSW